MPTGHSKPIDTTTPISSILPSGGYAKALEQRGVGTLVRLLAASTGTLLRATGASRSEVERWRANALLRHIVGVSQPMATVLIDAGVTSLDGLLSKTPAWLQTTFEEAVKVKRLPHVPTSDEIAALLVDCARLLYGGSITGLVVDSGGTPVGGAEVALGAATTKSDAHGCFRLLRLRDLGRGGLSVHHAEKGEAFIAKPPVSANPWIIMPVMITLAPNTQLPELREFAGDKLPQLVGVRYHRRRVPLSQVEDGDVLVIFEGPTKDGRWTLFSPFRSFRAGIVSITVVSVGAAHLPVATPAVGQAFSWSGSELRAIDRRLATRRAQLLLRALRERGPKFPNRAATPAELQERIKAKLRWAAEQGLARAPRGTR